MQRRGLDAAQAREGGCGSADGWVVAVAVRLGFKTESERLSVLFLRSSSALPFHPVLWLCLCAQPLYSTFPGGIGLSLGAFSRSTIALVLVALSLSNSSLILLSFLLNSSFLHHGLCSFTHPSDRHFPCSSPGPHQ